MPENYQLALALRAFQEVQAELGELPPPGMELFPGLAGMLERLGTIPPHALLCGIDTEGLPLVLHLRNPRPGPVLVAGERGSGKTAFLKALVRSTTLLHAPGKIRFIVLTEFPDEWETLHTSPAIAAIHPSHAETVTELLFKLACRAQYRDLAAPLVLLFDGLDSVLHMEPTAQHNLEYLLAHGPQALIWPIVAVNAERAMTIPQWLAFFRTRIYGRISHPMISTELTPLPGAELNTLFPGYQFCIREKSRWVHFFLPGML